jgi:hypothetical protein
MSMFIPNESPSDQPDPLQQPEQNASAVADSASAALPIEVATEASPTAITETSIPDITETSSEVVVEAQGDDADEAEATSQVVAVMPATVHVADVAEHTDANVFSESNASDAAGEAARGRGFPPFYAVSTRIAKLNRAIGLYPESPVNYILRGEAFLEEDQRDQAVDDFLAAIALAERRETTWEYINHAMLDRARQGLRRCRYTP